EIRHNRMVSSPFDPAGGGVHGGPLSGAVQRHATIWQVLNATVQRQVVARKYALSRHFSPAVATACSFVWVVRKSEDFLSKGPTSTCFLLHYQVVCSNSAQNAGTP